MWALATHLTALGHEVHVVCAADPPESRLVDCMDGVAITRLGYPLKVANTNITPALPVQLLRERFDVVHTHLPTPWSADWSALIAQVRRRRLVVSYFNHIMGNGVNAIIARAYNASVLRFTLGSAHRIVVNSPFMLRASGSPLAPYAAKVVTMPLGVDATTFAPNPALREPDTVGFLSVLDPYHAYKGLDVLLRAMARLVAIRPKARLIVAGGGAMEQHYRDQAGRLDPPVPVEFLGRIPDGDLASFYNRCAVFSLPSTDANREGFGLVALEAAACAVPVVASRAAGVAHFMTERSLGRVVPAGDPIALAEALAAQLESGPVDLRARATIEQEFAWEQVARETARLYTTVAE